MQKRFVLGFALAAAALAHDGGSCQDRLDPTQVRALLLKAYNSDHHFPERIAALEHAQSLLNSSRHNGSHTHQRYEIAALTMPSPEWLRDLEYVHSLNRYQGTANSGIFARADALLDAHIDRLAGLDIVESEKQLEVRDSGPQQLRQNFTQRLHASHPAWSHANPLNGWSSHYLQLRQVLADLKLHAGQSLVDVGSGYGRMGLLMGMLYPDLPFTGYELVPERVQQAQAMAQRLRLRNVRFVAENVANSTVPIEEADVYFFYDSLNPSDFQAVLDKVRPYAARRHIRFVITRGSGRLLAAARANKALNFVEEFLPAHPFSERACVFDVLSP